MEKENESKWIVVTGASSGIGKATAQCLLEQGYSVVVTSRSRSKLEDIFDPYGTAVKVIDWDLSHVETIKEYAGIVRENVGPISGLVHCAGVQKIAPVHMIQVDKIHEVFNINTFAGICLVSAFSKKKMYNVNGMSCVFISSISAHSGAAGNSIYAGSKGALEAFVSSAASELAQKGIRINSLVPGRVQTSMVEEFVNNLTEREYETMKSEYPLGLGRPEDIAEFIAFLLSEKSRWVTGQNYVIDGGHLVRTSH